MYALATVPSPKAAPRYPQRITRRVNLTRSKKARFAFLFNCDQRVSAGTLSKHTPAPFYVHIIHDNH
jgi:hypothetical protein